MTPLHLWALLGAGAGVVLPVAIHLLTKPRGERRALPPLKFLVPSANRAARRNRLRAFLVLAVRILTLVLLSMAFARWAERSMALPPGEKGTIARKVIVLDCSMSMRAQSSGVSLFDHARVLTQKILDEPGLAEADLVMASHQGHAVFGRTSPNLTALKEEVAHARATCERLDATAAIEAASRSLAGLQESALPACEVVIVSDLQRSNWTRASFAPLPKEVPVRIVSVRPSEKMDNVAITDVGVSGLPESGAKFFAIAEISNFGGTDRSVQVELAFDGRTWSRDLVLPAGQPQSVSIELSDIPAGWRFGHFKVSVADGSDALEDDNRCPMALRVQAARQVAMVTAEAADELGGPAHLLARALEASPEATVVVARYHPAQLEGEPDPALWGSDVLVVVAPGQLSDAQAAGLGRLLTGGMPILLVTQVGADGESLHTLQAALGAGLRMPVEFYPLKDDGNAGSAFGSAFARRTNVDERGSGRFLVSVDQDHRPFSIFGDSITRFTKDLKVGGGLASRPAGETSLLTNSVRARYNDGSAAVLVVPVASARLAILNMSVGGGGRHVAGHPIFVPMIQELCLELLNADAAHGKAAGCCGEDVVVSIDRGGAWRRLDNGKAQDHWVLMRDDQKEAEDSGPAKVTFRADLGGASMHWSRAGKPGVYRIEYDGKLQTAFALVPPFKDECDLEALDREVVEKRLAKDRTVLVVAAQSVERSESQGKETFGWFLLGALGCLLCELLLLKGFRS